MAALVWMRMGLLRKLLQLQAVEEGFETDLLDAVEFVQGRIFNQGFGFWG